MATAYIGIEAQVICIILFTVSISPTTLCHHFFGRHQCSQLRLHQSYQLHTKSAYGFWSQKLLFYNDVRHRPYNNINTKLID